MLLNELMDEMLLPDREVIIGKTFYVHGESHLLIGFTQEGEKASMWVLREVPHLDDDIMKWEFPVTYREEVMWNLVGDRVSDIHIDEVEIQNVGIRPNRSCSWSLGFDPNGIGNMKLAHFVQAGLSLEGFGHFMLKQLILTCYVMDIPFPEIDLKRDLELKVRTGDRRLPKALDEPVKITINPGENTTVEPFSISDGEGGEIKVFIDELCFHSFSKAMEQISPAGYINAYLLYENDRNVELNFYTSEYLDREIDNSGCSTTAVGMIFRYEKGPHGFDIMPCSLEKIPLEEKDKPIEVELLSWTKIIPGEEICAD